jgi:RNA exonuclease 1
LKPQIVHDKVIDTAIIYHSTRGPPHKPSLRYLAQTHLQLRIQENEHDPIEDARTCMRLVQMKLEKGRYFGLTISETESLFTRIGRNGKRNAIIDTKYGLNTAWPVDSQITCENDGEIAEAVEIGMADCDFVWSRVRSLESAAQNDSSVAVTPANMQARVSELNEIVEKVWQALPDGAVLIVVSAHGDTRDASRLMKERNEYQRRCAQENVLELHQNHPELVFGPEKMDELERAVSYGVIGVGMIATKQ